MTMYLELEKSNSIQDVSKEMSEVDYLHCLIPRFYNVIVVQSLRFRRKTDTHVIE